MKSSKPIYTGMATKYLLPRWGHYLSPPSCLSFLLPLESIPTLQFYIFRAVRFFQRNLYVPIRELIKETLLSICIDSKVLALVVPGLVEQLL